jgi:uncharacterized protein
VTSFAERAAQLPPLGVGLGYRGPLRACFRDPEAPIRCVEVTAEHFFRHDRTPPPRPPELGARPVMVHGLDLSLGTPGPLDEDYVQRFLAVAEGLQAVLISDHLAVTRTAEVELGHLNPVPPTRATRDHVAAKIKELQARANRLFLLENVTTHLRLPGELSFPELLNGICSAADCGILLDVTNLYINARNFGGDPLAFLDRIDLSRVVQLHVVGFQEREGRLYDTHQVDIQESIFDLTQAVLERSPARAVIVERDGHYPAPAALYAQLERLESIYAAARREPA